MLLAVLVAALVAGEPPAGEGSEAGRAWTRCQITELGTMAGCEVVFETPPGLGLGERALKKSKLIKTRPRIENGLPVAGGEVTFEYMFKLTDLPAPPPPGPLSLEEALTCYGIWSARSRDAFAGELERFHRDRFTDAVRERGAASGLNSRAVNKRMKAALQTGAPATPIPERCNDLRY